MQGVRAEDHARTRCRDAEPDRFVRLDRRVVEHEHARLLGRAVEAPGREGDRLLKDRRVVHARDRGSASRVDEARARGDPQRLSRIEVEGDRHIVGDPRLVGLRTRGRGEVDPRDIHVGDGRRVRGEAARDAAARCAECEEHRLARTLDQRIVESAEWNRLRITVERPDRERDRDRREGRVVATTRRGARGRVDDTDADLGRQRGMRRMQHDRHLDGSRTLRGRGARTRERERDRRGFGTAAPA